MSEIVLQVTDLTKQYRKHLVVDHISLEIRKGDIYCLTGGQGSGKTILTRLLLGAASPSAGSFSLLGATSEKEIGKARVRIGSLADSPALFQNLTPMQNLKAYKKLLRVVEPDMEKEDLTSLLEMVGLDPEDKRAARKLSGGAKQRLGIAISLLGSPELLILDEPYKNLAPKGMAQMRELLLKLHKEWGLTIFYTCENLALFPDFATRYGFLYQGRLQMELTAEELKEHHKALTLEEYDTMLKKKFAEKNRGRDEH